ncbi:formate dehydrogenase subunit delta [Streptomyces sp. NPDC058045]|uniref:formate dehydrogenase subunit delta n=1 Tax=Streptomyces sp. NPDC058045 TaxID=3346311 RepID=UPI0036E0229B
MANDIAAAFGHLPEEQAVQAVANHIGRFWDPRMRSRLAESVGAGAEGLPPVVVAAVRSLNSRQNGAG